MTYCLRAMGVLHTAGKRGNAILHRRVDNQSGTTSRAAVPER
jgi:hypothetical protein